MGKSRNYTARAGQQIAGRLYRGKGGKFSAGGSGAAPANKSTTPDPADSMTGAWFEDGSIPSKFIAIMNQIMRNRTITDKKALEVLRNSGLLTETNKLSAIARAIVKAARRKDQAEVKRLSLLAMEKYQKKQTAAIKRKKESQQPENSSPAQSLLSEGEHSPEGVQMKGKGAIPKADGNGAGSATAIIEPEATDVLEGFDPETMTLAEYWEYYGSGAKTFADLIAAQKADEAASQIRELAWKFPMLVNNIVNDPAETNKPSIVRRLAGEFADLIEGILREIDGGSTQESDAVLKFHEELETPGRKFEEVEPGEPLAEGAEGTAADPHNLTVAVVEVEIIQPGWGNRKDNNFYPAEVLRRDAQVFVGAKQYETDHRAEEKSTRTWVSTVKEIKGFSPAGAPIALVAIHDPNFAQRVRNLNELGLLTKMECSIFGQGKAVPFAENGRKGHRVEKLIEVTNVDWVTRAGAGGKVIGLVESDQGGNPMDQNKNGAGNGATQEPQDQPEITPAAGAAAPVAENAGGTPSVDVKIQESNGAALDKVKVVELINGSTLPLAARKRMAEQSYLDEAAVTAAIESEIAYLKEITGSGKPAGLGESAAAPAAGTASEADLAEVEKAHTAANDKFLGGSPRRTR